MINNLLDIIPLQGILIQTPINQINHRGIQSLLQRGISLVQINRLVDNILQIRLLPDIERIRPNQELIQHDPDRPDIDLLVVLLPGDQLRAEVKRGPAEGCTHLGAFEDRPAEVAQLYRFL